MRRVLGLFLLLLVVLLGLSFALLNAGSAELDYYFGSVSMPLSLLVVLVLIVGAVLGVLATMTMMIRRRREISSVRRRLAETEKELNELRRLPLKDQP
ncbi:MAG: LapA family protein [Ectothiorhodospiraceae bacterium]|nr:LapA family protein [Ectothiorhodospiraceae bacterium]MCH8505241.1 LapA family protein [Ectothiorhodospiraceae bacterium]